MKRKSNIEVGTVGSLECEKFLERLLVGLNESKITRPVLSRLLKHKETAVSIAKCNMPEDQKVNLLKLAKKNAIENCSTINTERVPPKVISSLKCCITAHYRIGLKGAK